MKYKPKIIFESRLLGGVIVSVLAIESKVRVFNSGRGDWFLRAMKIRSTHSF
jgi:hypothetical protein